MFLITRKGNLNVYHPAMSLKTSLTARLNGSFLYIDKQIIPLNRGDTRW